MKFYKKIVIVLLFIGITLIYAQNFKEITGNSKFIYGIGSSSNPNRADKEALRNLISQISVQVESKFVNVIEESGEDVQEYTELILNTYSNVMLNEARSKQVQENGKFHVIRYMEEKDLEAVFENRKSMINEFIVSGSKAKNEKRIGDALKYYYWALCLLKSHPDMDTITGKEIGIPERLFTALPEKIESILDSITITISSSDYIKEENRKLIYLDFKYNKVPISNLDYVYYTGNMWTNHFTSVKNGLGYVEFFGAAAKDMKNVKLRIEYIYDNKCRYNVALASVILNTNIPYFSKADIKISGFLVKNTPQNKIIKKNVIGEYASKETKKDRNKYFNTVLRFINAFENKSFANMKDLFTDEGEKMISKLLQYGNAEIIKTREINLTYCKINDDFIVRSIPFKFKFPYTDKEFVEEVVFILNKKGKIQGINFALSDIAINDIMKHKKEFGTIEHKQQIVHFMESYKTAYCLKNIDYIAQVFSDDALIIIGQSLKPAGNIDSMYSEKLSNDDVYYIKTNKKDYLERLRSIFASNETINIHFEDTEVMKVNRTNDYVYGIQIAQNYYSTNYADFGYLFLMFDLNKPVEPKIYVRSWQPQKNPDGTIMGLNDFIF